MSAGKRISDWAFFAYFAFQIPSTFFFDAQGVWPQWLFPEWAKSLHAHYVHNFKDAFLEDAWKYPWYLSCCLVEHVIEFPFFIWAAYSYYYGARAKPAIVLPALMYGVHTFTIVLALWAMAMLSEFNPASTVFPTTFGERINLCMAYFPFMVFSLWIVVDSFRLLRPPVKRD